MNVFQNHVVLLSKNSGHCVALSSLLLLVLISCIECNLDHDDDVQETFETILYEDSDGFQHEEYAFRAPSRGLPEHVLDMFCSSVKLRLYWNEYRDQTKDTRRKGIYLRRMARLARHLFDEVKDADKPFNATMLSRTDDYFNVKLEDEDEKIDKAIASRANKVVDEQQKEQQRQESDTVTPDTEKPSNKLRSFKDMISKRLSDGKNRLTSGKSDGDSDVKDAIDEIEASESLKQLQREGQVNASLKIKEFVKNWAPKVALGVYTRWRTMWWMMMSCLFTKYYLWDPALDEFTKLKRSLVMWPELQLVRLQDLSCKPLMLFRRLMDVCMVLNPLMNVDFGQFNLDKMTRFKSNS